MENVGTRGDGTRRVRTPVERLADPETVRQMLAKVRAGQRMARALLATMVELEQQNKPRFS